MQSPEQLSEPPLRDSKGSFNRFMAVVIVLMLVTGALSIWDNWGGDVVESTGPNEQKKLELPNDLRITLHANSEVRFQKGSNHKLVLEGSAEVEIGTTKITVETLEVITKAENARFEILTRDGESYVKVLRGEVDLILKPAKDQVLTLQTAEEYLHSFSP